MDEVVNKDSNDFPTKESDVEHNEIRYANIIRISIDKASFFWNIVKIVLGNSTCTVLAIKAPNIRYFTTSNISYAVCFSMDKISFFIFLL